MKEIVMVTVCNKAGEVVRFVPPCLVGAFIRYDNIPGMSDWDGTDLPCSQLRRVDSFPKLPPDRPELELTLEPESHRISWERRKGVCQNEMRSWKRHRKTKYK